MDFETDGKTVQPHEKKPLYEFKPLPKWEGWFYFLYIFIGSPFVYPLVLVASAQYQWESPDALSENHTLPYFGVRRKDITNYEWHCWTPYGWKMIPWFVGHSVMFNTLDKVLPHRVWHGFMFTYWITICVCVYGVPLVSIAMAVGVFFYCCIRITKSKLLIWLLSGAILGSLWFINLEDLNPLFCDYILAGFLVYKILQYISFCFEECDNGRPENKKFFNGLYNMFWYAFYLPYLNSLIVTYKRFPAQIAERKTKPRNWGQVMFFALRITFWFTAMEFFLHFLYVDAICTDAKFLRSLDCHVLLLVGYIAGQLYHIRYVIMFGVPATFARADNMQPPEGPICLSRVALYSKMWRSFDRGFYDFFKEYIFLPICRPTFSMSRKIVGVLVSFGFVLLWHGFRYNYIIWIMLNIVELVVETCGKIVYTIPSVRRWREAHLSDHCFRRILAILILCPWAFSCYAGYYFIMEPPVAYVFVERMFWEHTVNLNYQLFSLIWHGYIVSQLLIGVDIYMNKKEKKDKTE